MNKKRIKELKKAYNLLVKGIELQADEEDDRAFGGVIRAGKGKLVESIAQEMVGIAWDSIGGKSERTRIDRKKIRIPIKTDYIHSIEVEEVKKYIMSKIDDYYFNVSVDNHIYIDNNFILGIECKAYTENAMIKRILVDFSLLKTQFPDLVCVVLQLESQLGGDYSKPLNDILYGSPSTHTLKSYFEDVDLQIITLLEGERKVDQPIHNVEHFKELKYKSLEKAVLTISNLLRPYV